MKIKEYNYSWCPKGMDKQCIELCRVLNQLPGIETYESCEGHGQHPYWIFFRCTDLGTLSRLGRVVARNYSDNNWEIVIDSSDTDPYGCFWLRTKSILTDKKLQESLKQLIDSIYYWFDDDNFDEYFSSKN